MSALVTEVVAAPTEGVTREAEGRQWRSWLSLGTPALAARADRRLSRPGNRHGLGPPPRRRLLHRALTRRSDGPSPVARRLVVCLTQPRRGRAQPRTAAARSAGAVHQGRPVRRHGDRCRRRRGRLVDTVVVVGRPGRRAGRRRRRDARHPFTLEASIGLQAFIDPRQQFYLLMPYWALLWLAWAVAAAAGCGDPPAGVHCQPRPPDPLHVSAPDAAARRCRACALRCRRAHPLASAARLARSSSVSPSDSSAGPSRCGTSSLGRGTSALFTNRGANEGIGWVDGAEVISSSVLKPRDSGFRGLSVTSICSPT